MARPDGADRQCARQFLRQSLLHGRCSITDSLFVIKKESYPLRESTHLGSIFFMMIATSEVSSLNSSSLRNAARTVSNDVMNC
ncbi:MAG: hypothetical protein ACOYL3_26845 [Desulfuromonadaceae bacterium]